MTMETLRKLRELSKRISKGKSGYTLFGVIKKKKD